MLEALSQFWPQLMAFAIALGLSLAINGVVFIVKKLSPNSPTIMRLLPALPGVVGGIMGVWTWPVLLELVFTGHAALSTVPWGDYIVINVFLGIGQGAVSSNLYKFWAQTIMGEDGALKRALFRFLDIRKQRNIER